MYVTRKKQLSQWICLHIVMILLSCGWTSNQTMKNTIDEKTWTYTCKKCTILWGIAWKKRVNKTHNCMGSYN